MEKYKICKKRKAITLYYMTQLWLAFHVCSNVESKYLLLQNWKINILER